MPKSVKYTSYFQARLRLCYKYKAIRLSFLYNLHGQKICQEDLHALNQAALGNSRMINTRLVSIKDLFNPVSSNLFLSVN
jgi:hypothetical protein